MALSAKSIAGLAGNGLAAAATARPMAGGRGVAAAAQQPVETSEFAGGIGVNDNSILHYDEEGGLNPDGRGRGYGGTPTPYVNRGAFGFEVEDLSQEGNSDGVNFLSDVLYGIGIYENNLRVVASNQTRPGSIINRWL